MVGDETTYPGVEVLPDDKESIVVTTYGHWIKGEAPFILSTRFSTKELQGHSERGSKILLEEDAMKVRK